MEEVTYEASSSGLCGGLMTPVLNGLRMPHCADAAGADERSENETISHSIKSSRETLLSFVILANCITMGLELDYPWDGWSGINQAMLVLYIIDLCVRMWQEGLQNFAMCPWSWIDTLVVLASILEFWILPVLARLHQVHSAVSIAMFVVRFCRLIRALRVFTIMEYMKPLFNLFSGLSEAFSAILWLLILVIMVLYAFALVFVQLLGHGLLPEELDEEAYIKAKETFATVPLAIYALFRVMGADMTDLGPLLSGTSGIVLPLCYIFFQICTSWLLLSTLTATVVNTMLQFTERQKREHEMQKASQGRLAMQEHLSSFFDGLEVNGYEEVLYEDLEAFLSKPGSAETLQSIANICIPKALSTWEAMQVDGAVNVDKYIDQLVLVAGDNLESSVMRVEMQVRQLYELISRYLPALDHVTKMSLSLQTASLNAKNLSTDQWRTERAAIISPVYQSSPLSSPLPSKRDESPMHNDAQLQEMCRMLSGQLRADLASAVTALARGESSTEGWAVLPDTAPTAALRAFKKGRASDRVDKKTSLLSTPQYQDRRYAVCRPEDLPRLLQSQVAGISKCSMETTHMRPG